MINIEKKIEEAQDVIAQLGLPKAQQNERTAYCLLALLNLKPENSWQEIENPLIGITPIMDFTSKIYKKTYAPNSRETFRKESMHLFVQAGLVLQNPDDPTRPINSPKWCYQIAPEAFELIKKYGSSEWDEKLNEYLKIKPSLAKTYAAERTQNRVSVQINGTMNIDLSRGTHSELIKQIIEELAPRFLPNSTLIYVGDTGKKDGYFDTETAQEIGIDFDIHGKMPDVIFYKKDKNWLILVESVTSVGPMDGKRIMELNELFSACLLPKVFITAFPDKTTFSRFLPSIAWETEVWVADNPSHMIHFNGDKFLGPYT
ncbi:BsuBI/PstI family type II restriction endonuclease [Sphaerochaeta sp. PS]|uniref:BsuBI/PstI family type II restriction endonuclease n=1 Tax=Sphaerochaeta sp. PS TaxID=3076336 RepID=UPI0028A36543|nr:BsuBI/PstI family type II restriction endonuclease [Sphaerochaeta sp. PS]MDT4761849.1 BsuBI/PstI family type II restriction endonuclease [Sphaerochaeta sp. PS]